MIVLWLVRWRETNISSATATSDSRMISAEKGSILVRTAISLNSRGDDEVADSICADPLTGIDDSCGRRLLDDGGAHHLFFQTQPLARTPGRRARRLRRPRRAEPDPSPPGRARLLPEPCPLRRQERGLRQPPRH